MTQTTTTPRKVAFAITGGAGWIAGIHYFQNLFTAIRKVAGPEELEIFLLPAPGVTDDDMRLLMPYAAGVLRVPQPAPVQAPEPPRRSLTERIKAKLGLAKTSATAVAEPAPPAPVDPNELLGAFLKSQRIDAIFSTAEYGPNFPIRVFSWIPDFQHKELPEFFSDVEIRARDTSFGAMVTNAHRIVLSSNHAADVARRYYPEASAKLEVMPFVAQIPADVFQLDGAAVAAKYALPEKFIFLPNQLWKHKNHMVVIEAMTIAREAEPALTVACSGATTDYRDSSHVPNLQSRIRELKLDTHVRILGMIPEEDVFALMRQCICILQPSLYEGWSTVVEQAKSLGKPMLLSSLSVHIEQDPPASQFFDPKNPRQLAELLVHVHQIGRPGPDLELERAAAPSLEKRTINFGRRFLEIISAE